jgi:hypothetical protein
MIRHKICHVASFISATGSYEISWWSSSKATHVLYDEKFLLLFSCDAGVYGLYKMIGNIWMSRVPVAHAWNPS